MQHRSEVAVQNSNLLVKSISTWFTNGKKLASTEQEVPYVLATSPLESSDVPRPFQIDYFVKYLVLLPMSKVSATYLFAVGRWPQKHPRQHLMGKPVEVWCLNVYESSFNSFVPVCSIHGRTIVVSVLMMKTSWLLYLQQIEYTSHYYSIQILFVIKINIINVDVFLYLITLWCEYV